MQYKEALEFIGSRLRFGIKPGLERTRSLLERLGEPQRKLRFVHIAGTNGKGSTCTMTAAGLIAAGYRTGLYTSPYITDFRERMQIDGEMISEAELAELTERVSAQMDDAEQITEFELITCIALLWFAERECDIVVLETGLGGRLDSTNIIENPECTAITRIDLDHTAILGDTVAAIAGEKAGIIKPGCPVVLADDQPWEAVRVIAERAEQLDCELIRPFLGDVVEKGYSLSGSDIEYHGLKLHIPLLGNHQITNCITAVEILRTLGIEDKYIVEGVANAGIPARLELLSASPVVILDGAHNPNGAAALADAIDTLLAGKRIIGLIGVLADKDYTRELELLGPRMDTIFCCDGFSPRCLEAGRFAGIVGKYTDNAVCIPKPEEAFDAAYSILGKNDALVICGSLYLAGRIRPYAIGRLGGE